MIAGKSDHDYPSPEDTWELMKACGLMDDETEKLIDQYICDNEGVENDMKEGEWEDGTHEDIQYLWNEYEMANEMEKFESSTALHTLLAANPVSGPYMVPDERTLKNKEWASMWDGTQPVRGEYPFTTEMLDRSLPHRPVKQDMWGKEVNKIDEENRIIVDAEITQFGRKYHTAKCEFGRIWVPLKFNRYLKGVGEPMKMLVRVKEIDQKHHFRCIKVL
jgi:hypothetical protein